MFGIKKKVSTNIVIPLTLQTCILRDLHNVIRVSSKNKKYLSLIMYSQKEGNHE